MPGGQPPRTGAFISYSHADTLYLNQLRVSLKASMRQQPLDIWDDTMIQPGDHWRAEIERALAKARVAVLLVSPDFLASDFITANELPPLLAAAEQEGLVVLPVIVRRSLYEESLLGHYQTINPPDRPLNAMTEPERDEVWVRLMRRIKAVLEAPLPGTTLLTYTDHTEGVLCVAWAPDSKCLASGGSDKTVHIWDAATGQRLLTHTGHADWTRALAWSPDARRLASGSVWLSGSRTVQVWEAQTGQQIFSFGESSGHIVWSLDGRLLAIDVSPINVDGAMHILDASAGQALATYQGKSKGGEFGVLASFIWSPDGRLITGIKTFYYYGDVLGGPSPKIEVWQFPIHAGALKGNQIATYHGHKGGIIRATLSPDGARVASASWDGPLHIWDARTAQTLHICQSPDKTLILAWSPDGNYLAAAKEDTSIQVWDTRNGALAYTYTGHTEVVRDVAWSPDGTRIASVSYDKTVQVWVAP